MRPEIGYAMKSGKLCYRLAKSESGKINTLLCIWVQLLLTYLQGEKMGRTRLSQLIESLQVDSRFTVLDSTLLSYTATCISERRTTRR